MALIQYRGANVEMCEISRRLEKVFDVHRIRCTSKTVIHAVNLNPNPERNLNPLTLTPTSSDRLWE